MNINTKLSSFSKRIQLNLYLKLLWAVVFSVIILFFLFVLDHLHFLNTANQKIFAAFKFNESLHHSVDHINQTEWHYKDRLLAQQTLHILPTMRTTTAPLIPLQLSTKNKLAYLEKLIINQEELLKQFNQSNEGLAKLILTSQLNRVAIQRNANEILNVQSVLVNEEIIRIQKHNKFFNIIFTCIALVLLGLLAAINIISQRINNKIDQSKMKYKSLANELSTMIESTSDMIAALNTNLEFIYFNKSYKKEFEKLFNTQIHLGLSLESAIAHLPSDKDNLIEAWKASLTGNESIRNVEIIRNGIRRSYELSSNLLKHDDEIIGAIHVVRNISERIETQIQLRHAYDEIQNSMHELQDKNEKISLLLEMSDVMLACHSVKELSDVIASYCDKVLSFSSGIFYIMHPSKDYLESSAQWKSPVNDKFLFSHDQCWALRLGHIHHAATATSELICEHVKREPEHNIAYMCVPLRAQNDIYGLLYLEIIASHKRNTHLSKNERLIVNAFAELAALSLANVRLRENLQYQSIRDPLTALYNRRYLEEFLSKQIHQSERTNMPIALLLMDLDHFKRINDVYGHDAGDLVLKIVGQELLHDIRPGDMAARYGGEEFVVVLYNMNEDVAKKRAEALRTSISLLQIKYGAQQTGNITVSIGIAVYPKDGLSGTALIEAADKALYYVKRHGRNKTMLFSELAEMKSSIKNN